MHVHTFIRTHIESAVCQVEQGARFMEQGWDDSLPHVQRLVGRVFDAIHEDVALLGVSVKVDEQQHLVVTQHRSSAGASKGKHRQGRSTITVVVAVEKQHAENEDQRSGNSTAMV